jgi:hypothetical protein
MADELEHIYMSGVWYRPNWPMQPVAQSASALAQGLSSFDYAY